MKYKTKIGFLNLVGTWVNRLIWTFVLVMAAINFESNPAGLGILIGIILLALSAMKTDELIADGVDIIVRRRYFYDLVPVNIYFNRDEIAELRIEGNRTMNVNIITNILPITVSVKNTIQFVLKDGTVKSFKTDIFMEELIAFKENY